MSTVKFVYKNWNAAALCWWTKAKQSPYFSNVLMTKGFTTKHMSSFVSPLIESKIHQNYLFFLHFLQLGFCPFSWISFRETNTSFTHLLNALLHTWKAMLWTVWCTAVHVGHWGSPLLSHCICNIVTCAQSRHKQEKAVWLLALWSCVYFCFHLCVYKCLYRQAYGCGEDCIIVCLCMCLSVSLHVSACCSSCRPLLCVCVSLSSGGCSNGSCD